MSAKRALTAAVALLLIAAIPVHATTPPTFTVVDSINPGSGGSYALDSSDSVALGDYLYFRAYDGTNGVELWRTNGTTTTLVQDIRTGADSSYPAYFTALGDYIYLSANNGTANYVYRTNGTGTERVPFPIDADQYRSCGCYDTSLVAVGGRLFSTVYSSATGTEFAYLDEPTYVLPRTNRGSSVWTTTLVILAGLTAAASIGLRVRGAKRA